NEPLNKIAISRAFHELWKRNDIQSEENDCNRLLEILNELMAENLDSDRKRHLISLQDIDKKFPLYIVVCKDDNNVNITFTDAKFMERIENDDLIRFETDESPDWKVHAIRNIGNIKDRLQKANTSVHERLLEEIQDVDINDLTYDDPLANGIVDLGSSQYQLVDDDYDVLVGEKGGIRNLRKGSLIKRVCVDYVTKRNEIQNRCKFIIAPSETTRHKHW
ncbi:21772_t:CDS:2, partial [Racocetra persica]